MPGSRSLRSLRFAARGRVVAHHLGLLLLPLGVVNCVPAAAAWALGRADVAVWQLGVALLLVSLGLVGRRFMPGAALQRNEALVLTAVAFGAASLAGTAPFLAVGMSPLDAWFEAVSGATTTGLSVLPSVGEAPRALLFARAWLQWIGGLGVLVLALALVITPGASARRLGFDSREMVDIVGGTRAHARRVLAVYLALTTAGIVLLAALGMDLFDALLHTLAAVSTGGFSTRDGSLASFPVRQQIGVIALCFSGGVAFSFYYLTLVRDPRRSLRDPRLLGLLACCAVGALTLVGIGALRGGTSPPALDLALTAVSAQTTAGFSTIRVADLDSATRVVAMVAMFVGGEIGSTAGGIKVFRFLLVLDLLLLLLNRTSIPTSGRLGLRVGGDRIEGDEVESVVALVAAYAGLIALSWLVLLLYGYDALDALFDVVSAVGTVGLSSGLTGPDLEALPKFVLSLDMWMGRVEVIAFLLLVRPSTWIGLRRED